MVDRTLKENGINAENITLIEPFNYKHGDQLLEHALKNFSLPEKTQERLLEYRANGRRLREDTRTQIFQKTLGEFLKSDCSQRPQIDLVLESVATTCYPDTEGISINDLNAIDSLFKRLSSWTLTTETPATDKNLLGVGGLCFMQYLLEKTKKL